MYFFLDNSIYILGSVYLLFYIIRYRTEKLGTHDTDRVHDALFSIYYSRKCKELNQWVRR